MSEKLKKSQIFAYSLGGFGKNLAYVLVSSYTLYYYNYVLNINASFVAVLLMAARLFDAFNDPVMGIIVSKTNTKFGKYKPWILSGAVLDSLVIVAMFSIPESLSTTGIKWYISVTYFLCGITYTLNDIPFWSVIPAITAQGRERENTVMFVRTMCGIATGLGTAFLLKAVTHFGGGSSPEQMRNGFKIVAVIIAVIYSGLTLISVFNLPMERYKEDSTLSVKQIFKLLLKNDKAIILCIIIVSFWIAIGITLNFAIYLFDYDVVNHEQYTVYTVIIGVIEFAAMLGLYPLLRKKFSDEAIFTFGFICGLIGYLSLLCMIKIPDWNFLIIMIPSIFIAIMIGIAYVLITVLIANVVDYGEQKTGIRQNSMVSSLQTLMCKIGSSVAVFLTGIGIDFVGFSNDPVQSNKTLIKERLLFTIPSSVFLLIAIFLCVRFLLKEKNKS